MELEKRLDVRREKSPSYWILFRYDFRSIAIETDL